MEDETISILQEIRKKMKEMRNENAALREKIKGNNNNVLSIIDKLQKDMELRTKAEKEWIKEKELMEKRIADLESKEEEKDRRERKNNILINGLKTNSKEIKMQVIEFIKQEMGIDSDVKEAYKIGNKGGQGLIIAKIGSWEEKQTIMKNKGKLVGKENKLVRPTNCKRVRPAKVHKPDLDIVYISSSGEEDDEPVRDILETAMEGLFTTPEPSPQQQQQPRRLFTEPSPQQQPLSMEDEALEELLRYAATSSVSIESIAAVLGATDAATGPPSPSASVTDSDTTVVDAAFTVETRVQSPATEPAPTSPDAQVNWWEDGNGDWERNFQLLYGTEHQVVQRLEDEVPSAALESQASPSQIPCGQRSPVQPEPQDAWWDDDSDDWGAVKLDEDAPVPLRNREIINGYADDLTLREYFHN
ncbi:hypothetical protein CBL_05230 [Carabus blaptoides fortunei]